MRYILFAFLFVFCLTKEEQPKKDKDGIVELKESNFDNYVRNHEYVFVNFYAPWVNIFLLIIILIFKFRMIDAKNSNQNIKE